MTLIVSEVSNHTPAPAGLHNAVCTAVIDLGIQVTPYGNKPQVLIIWELDTLMDNGQRFTLSRKFTPSLSKKSPLRAIWESWRGRPFTAKELSGFELRKVLGKSCKVLVQHALSADGSRTYANVASVIPIDKGVVVMPNAEPLYFDMDNPDLSVKVRLPEWAIKMIDSAITPQPAIETPYSAASDEGDNYELGF